MITHDVGDTVGQELLARHAEGKLSFRLRRVVMFNGGLFPETHRAILVQKLLLSPLGFVFTRFMKKEKLAAAVSCTNMEWPFHSNNCPLFFHIDSSIGALQFVLGQYHHVVAVNQLRFIQITKDGLYRAGGLLGNFFDLSSCIVHQATRHLIALRA